MPSFGKKLSVRAIAVILALLADALFVFLITGLNPIDFYNTMIAGTFANSLRFSYAIRDMASLLMIGIALAPAFKMRFWNVGAEGQVLMGGLATAMVMVYCGSAFSNPETKTTSFGLYVLMFLAAVLAGALWGFIPAYFKARYNTNETLFTLMMNYIAIQIVSCFVNLWRGQAAGLGKLNKPTKAGWFPGLFPDLAKSDSFFGRLFGQTYTINWMITILFVVLVFLYLRYTKQGYEITVVGESNNTARYAGINVGKVIIRTMIISGAICGLTGFMIVGGRDQTIAANSAGGNGFTAIIVAWLAKFNTFYMLLISFMLTFLSKGAAEISSVYHLNDYCSSIVTGIILFFILGSEFFINYRLVFRGHNKEVG